ncbi:hypothetical protein [Plesiocystis pacifica]|uniref:hypothetical protein n=1 Tax=Plesiocystis pacifica TaxID=191768 RepID=UPI0012F7931D|nr:hypothetical protein [Plesiocystis pacifica]
MVFTLGSSPQECTDTDKDTDTDTKTLTEADQYYYEALRSQGVRCDDGTPMVVGPYKLNEHCSIDGCLLGSQSCWNYKLEHCYDDGEPNQMCELAESTCTTSWGCAWLLANCEGEWACATPSWCVCHEEK